MTLALSIGLVLIILGYLVQQHSVIVSKPEPFEFTPEQQAAYDAHVRSALRAVAPGAVVPMQRDASRWS